MKQVNTRKSFCRQCGMGLEPGEGNFWPHPNPLWSEGYGRYLCDSCFAFWSTWHTLTLEANPYLEDIRWYIRDNLPGAPRLILQDGELVYRDQRSYTQAYVQSIIYSSGLAYSAVARSVSEQLYVQAVPFTHADELIEFVHAVRFEVIDRISHTIHIPFIKSQEFYHEQPAHYRKSVVPQ